MKAFYHGYALVVVLGVFFPLAIGWVEKVYHHPLGPLLSYSSICLSLGSSPEQLSTRPVNALRFARLSASLYGNQANPCYLLSNVASFVNWFFLVPPSMVPAT